MQTRESTCAVLALASIVAVATPVRSDVILVDQSATSGANTGTSWADAFPDLQAALAAAVGGDEIWVAAGTYRPTARTSVNDPRSATFELETGVALYGGFAGSESSRDERDPVANITTLSGDLNGDDADVADPAELLGEPTRADNSYHVVTGSRADETGILDGFTITAGHANGSGNLANGGGMVNFRSRGTRTRAAGPASPTLVNCRFSRNSALGDGGGLHSEGGDPTLTQCTFTENTTGNNGGGMTDQGGNATLTGCTFRGNTSLGSSLGEGAGMAISGGGRGTLTNCTFVENQANIEVGSLAGGLAIRGSSPTVMDCTFLRNVSRLGGGLSNLGSNSTIINCIFIENRATGQVVDWLNNGGGAFNFGGSPTFTNCTFNGNIADDVGGGMANENASPTVINCTFSGNLALGIFFNDFARGLFGEGGGMANFRGSSPVVANCIFWGNRFEARTDESAQIFTVSGGGNPVVNYSCVQGGWTGAGGIGNISVDPLFVGVDDLQLRPGSPAIDAGDNSAVSAEIITDLAGNARFLDDPTTVDAGNGTAPIVDMGAYEFGDCNGNGVLDAQDIADGTSEDCTGNGIPDECEADCNGNGVADSCDIAAGTISDFNGNGVPTECEPELLQIMDGLGGQFAAGSLDTFISPLAENVQLDHFTLEASEALAFVSAFTLYTGPTGTPRRGQPAPPLLTPPAVVGFTVQEGGLHRVEIDPAPEPGEWLKVSLRVRGASTGREAVMDVWLAHHPDDINQDGTVDVRDATAFGELFNSEGPPELTDLNGDGVIDVRDATTFGDLWHGRGGASQPWNGSSLPNKPR